MRSAEVDVKPFFGFSQVARRVRSAAARGRRARARFLGVKGLAVATEPLEFDYVLAVGRASSDALEEADDREAAVSIACSTSGRSEW